MLRYVALLALLFILSSPTSAASLTPGHLLAVSGQRLFELSTAGTIVKSLTIPGSTEPARDVTVDAASRVQIFHGLNQPLLSTWDTDENAWMHSTVMGWSTSEEVQSPGGLTPLGRDLIAIDLATAEEGSPRGLIRFAGENGYQAVRFAQDRDYIDVALGLDFHLYALRADQTTVDRYDRQQLESSSSFDPAETLSLPHAVRAIAVGRRGTLFAASWTGQISRIRPDGTVDATLISGTAQLLDLDLAQDGRLAVGARDGKIVLTTTALKNSRVLTLKGADAVFVAFVETPRQREVIETLFDEGHVGEWTQWIDP